MNSNFVSTGVIFKIALTCNLISVIWNIINDCDETYNYWEPLHFLIFGNGFQTWEYSPTYGLRSYFYLILCGWPAIIFNWFFQSASKRILFYIVRIYFAVLTTWLEVHLYRSLKKRFTNIEQSNIPLYCLLILVTSAGSFISSTAFLPSSFAFYCSMFAFSSWLRNDFNGVIASVGISTIIGWPFSAAIGIPFAIDIIFYRRKLIYFIKTAVIWGFVLVLSSMVIDSWMYGRVTMAWWNIVRYNVFNSHGSELYGVEPASFYVKNYLLNFNVAMFLVALYIVFVAYDWFRGRIGDDWCVGLMSLAVFTVWNGVFFLQSHKEERFLFPAYPFLAIISGVCIYKVESLFRSIRMKFLSTNIVPVIFFATYGLINAARIIAIVSSFGGSIALYSHLNDISHSTGSTVCLGREWHRFPSNFFIDRSMNASFIRSDFRGQLPAKFQSVGGMRASQIEHKHFNNLNREEPNRYLSPVQCNFIIDRVDPLSESVDEPNWQKLNKSKWIPVLSYKLLTPHSIGGALSIFRSFYVPFLFEQWNNFVDYVILEKRI